MQNMLLLLPGSMGKIVPMAGCLFIEFARRIFVPPRWPAILLAALVAVNCALASEERNPSENAEAAEEIRSQLVRYRGFDARLQPVPKDSAIAKSLEIEPLIRGLGVRLEAGVEAPDFDLPVLRTEVDDKGAKTGAVGKDTVRLSSFRGKKPVAITLSGST